MKMKGNSTLVPLTNPNMEEFALGHQAKALSLPLSWQILGKLVDAIRVEDDVLTDKTASRYYSGETIQNYSLKQLYLSFGETLIDKGIIPVPPVFKKYDISLPKIIAASASRLSSKWDKLCSVIQNRSGLIIDSPETIESFCRLLVIDLSLRIFALCRLADLVVSKPETPTWAEKNGFGQFLRRLIAQNSITRDKLFDLVDVTDKSVDNWLDGKILPTKKNLEALCIAFPSQSSQIHQQFMLAYIADILSNKIGRDKIIELSEALNRFTYLITEDVNTMDRPPINEVAGMEFEILRFGADSPNGHTLLRNLAMVESDINWKKDLMAATIDWSIRFQEIAMENTMSQTAGLAENYIDEASDDIKKVEQGYTLRSQDYFRIKTGDISLLKRKFNDDILAIRLVIKKHPLSALAHFTLGSYLGRVGKWLNKRSLINEGINECKIACTLRPNWDAPSVEPGIILTNVGSYDQALSELQLASSKLQKMTPHLAFALGYVLKCLQRHEEALIAFEIVIRAKPDYAIVLNYAAECALIIGDSKKGAEYAKKARKYGESNVYDDWQKGHYRNKGLPN